MRALHVAVLGCSLLCPCITADLAFMVRGGLRRRAVSRVEVLISAAALCKLQSVYGGQWQRPETRERVACGGSDASVVLAGRMQAGMRRGDDLAARDHLRNEDEVDRSK